jgi:ssDNA-binding Zn-finger/Zn-ribbon topoisomerase 1
LTRQLAEEFGVVDDCNALSWLDAVETRAGEIGDAIAAELVRQKSADRPVAEDESSCPQCGEPQVELAAQKKSPVFPGCAASCESMPNRGGVGGTGLEPVTSAV